MTLAPDDVKACCVAAYGSVAARILLGDSFHPGGAALTRELAQTLRLDGDSTAVDVGCGRGTSALLLARETGASVVGVDLAPANVAAAVEAAAAAGLDDRVRFLCGEAEALPLADASADAVLCECALCIFPDKRAAVGELARVLRPGGRLALSDMTADLDHLPAALLTMQAWVACIADARPLEQIASLLAGEGFAVEATSRHDDALTSLLDRVEARLHVLAMASVASAKEVGQGTLLLALARRAVAAGALGYGSLAAVRR